MVYSRYKTGHFLTSFLLHQFLQNFKVFFISAKLNTLNTSLPMGKTNDLTPRKKSAISSLLQNTDMSQREIARKMCISQASVSQIKKKLENGEELAASHIGKWGAKRKTSLHVKRNSEFLQTEQENEHTPDNKWINDSWFGGVWKNSSSEIVRTRIQVP